MSDLVDTNQPEPEPYNQRFAEHLARVLLDGPPFDGSRVVRAEAD